MLYSGCSFLRCLLMSHDSAFLAPSSVLGRYWTRRRSFDYLIDKDNFTSTFGRSFRFLVYLDPAVANGPVATRNEVEKDSRETHYLMKHLADIRPELTVFVTTCDMLEPDADENTPVLTCSDDPYVQNRIDLYHALNSQFGRVLNVHLPEIAYPRAEFNSLLYAVLNPPAGGEPLPFAPLESHQLYFPERILGDVERCIPLGISSIIPAAPPLTAREIVCALNPQLIDRLPAPSPSDPVGSRRKSIHSFQWLDPRDGYLVTKDDQLTLLNFFYGRESA